MNEGRLYNTETGVSGDDGGVSKNDEGLRTRNGDGGGLKFDDFAITGSVTIRCVLEKLKIFFVYFKFESDDADGYFFGYSSESLAVARQLNEFEMLLTKRGEKLNVLNDGGDKKLLLEDGNGRMFGKS